MSQGDKSSTMESNIILCSIDFFFKSLNLLEDFFMHYTLRKFEKIANEIKEICNSNKNSNMN